MVVAESLVKTFEDAKRGTVHAVDAVSFTVRRGEIFGLLGPNGAGKTTTLRLIATVFKPTGGTARLAGYDVVSAPLEVRRRLGFLSGDMDLYDRLTPRETLMFFGRLYGMEPAGLAERAASIVAKFGITDFADIRVAKLSTGMRQKTAVARAMLHEPPVLILDEPMAGLDVPTSHAIEQAILEAKNAGTCIIFSTHHMEEAEYLCDRIAVINNGRIRITGTMDDLRAATGKERLREIFLHLLELDSR